MQPVIALACRLSSRTKPALIAGITMLLSVGVFIASQLGAMPAGFSTTAVLIGMGIVLKLAWTISSKSASSAEHARLKALVLKALNG